MKKVFIIGALEDKAKFFRRENTLIESGYRIVTYTLIAEQYKKFHYERKITNSEFVKLLIPELVKADLISLLEDYEKSPIATSLKTVADLCGIPVVQVHAVKDTDE